MTQKSHLVYVYECSRPIEDGAIYQASSLGPEIGGNASMWLLSRWVGSTGKATLLRLSLKHIKIKRKRTAKKKPKRTTLKRNISASAKRKAALREAEIVNGKPKLAAVG